MKTSELPGSRRPPPKRQHLVTDERLFVARYVKFGDDATRAYQSIHPKANRKTANTQGWRMVHRPLIAAAIAAMHAKLLATVEVDAAWVIERLRRIADSDLSALFDDVGNLRPIVDLPPDVLTAVSSVEVIDRPGGDVRKIKLWDKVAALVALARNLGLLVDRSEVKHSADDALIAAIAEGRQRAMRDDRKQ
jgi:hypothetical protein